MYDPLETDTSYRYLLSLVEELGEGLVLIGGWAVYLHVNDRFRPAIGHEYLKSRDIDVIISSEPSYVKKFYTKIYEMDFVLGSLPFRYQLILDRDSMKALNEDIAKKKDTFDLLYIYLDVFTSSKVEMGTWVIEGAEKVFENKVVKGTVPMASAEDVLNLKLMSFVARDNIEKREKDACDLYALLFYSSLPSGNLPQKETLSHLADEFSEHIAWQLFNDRNYAGLVRRNIEGLVY